MPLIKSIIDTEDPPPDKPIFKFANSEEAASFNSKILASFNYDYEKIVQKQKKPTIFYNSEFRHPSRLHNLLKFHKSGDRLESVLQMGTDTSLSHLSKEILEKDCLANIEQGNHSSATRTKEDIDFVNETYKKK